MKPKRIQLSRKKGWRLPANTVVVSRPSKWGNPYRVGTFWLDLSVTLYARTIRSIWTPDNIPIDLISQAYELHMAFQKRHRFHPCDNARYELRGKNLACWCPLNQPCHADVLLEIANA